MIAIDYLYPSGCPTHTPQYRYLVFIICLLSATAIASSPYCFKQVSSHQTNLLKLARLCRFLFANFTKTHPTVQILQCISIDCGRPLIFAHKSLTSLQLINTKTSKINVSDSLQARFSP